MFSEPWKPHINPNIESKDFKFKFIPREKIPIPKQQVISKYFLFIFQTKVKTNPPKKENGLDFCVVALVISLVFSIQAILAVGSYSGEGVKPMHGDFEAQRHWLEITYNLPISKWYVNGTDNDLSYWGLDYPPLTAYHSWIMGFIANKINPSWVALHNSRGIETVQSKMFMRLTAILPFYLIYLPIVLAFCLLTKNTKFSQNILFGLTLGYAGLLAIDFGHFQYNSISLGFFIGSYIALVEGYSLIGSIFFCLAVNYKQMELYHALPIFVFILARSIRKPFFMRIPESIRTLLPIGFTVLTTFAVLWSPFIFYGKDSVLQVLGRVFPFYRGLYEDKVASFWCALSPVLKLNQIMSHASLLRLCTYCVLLASLPSLLVLFFRPTAKNFRYSLFITSLSFFLFSFQVHEKSILLPAIAALLLLAEFPTESSWFLHIANTSLFPLCVKDSIETTLFIFIVYYTICSFALPRFESKGMTIIKHLSCIGAVAICFAEWFITPPNSLPHIFPLLNAVYSCSHFLLFLFYFYVQMLGEEYGKWARKSE